MSVLIVGSIALDSIENQNGKKDDILGGSASYAAYASSLFAPTRLVGIVGDDFPQEYFEIFKSKQIDTEGLHTAPGKTFRWGGKYHADLIGRDTLFTELGVFETFNPELPESYKDSEYILLANIHPELQLQVLDQMEKPKLVATDTMNLWINISLDSLKEVISKTDILLINDEEARQLTGKICLTNAATALQTMGPELVIIKRGEHGASLYTPEGIFFVPAYPVTMVMDPTGAGDTFAGTLLGCIAQAGRWNMEVLRDAMVKSAVAASFTVEGFSLDSLIDISMEKIQERYEKIRQMTAF